MLKKRKKVIIISTVVSVIVIVLCLVLFIPYEATRSCGACYGGTAECYAKLFQEKLSGKKSYNHDCGLCINGYSLCRACDGTGDEIVTTTLFEELVVFFS